MGTRSPGSGRKRHAVSGVLWRWLRDTEELSGRSEGTWRRPWDGAGSLIQVEELEKDTENCEWWQVHRVGQGQEQEMTFQWWEL